MKKNEANSITFRKKLFTDPQTLDDEMLSYLASHPNEKATVKAARQLDQQISETLDVDVPEGLQARILLKQSIQAEHEKAEQEQTEQEIVNAPPLKKMDNNGSNTVTAMGKSKVTELFTKNPFVSFMAASVFAIGFGLVLINNPFSHHEHAIIGSDEIVAHVLEHLEHEPGLLSELEMPEGEQDMQQLFASVGAQLNQPVEGMKYAGICDIEGQNGLHIVMQQDNKPVTIIVMPGQQLAATQAFTKSGYKGELVPVKGGMVAIVGDTMEQVALAQIRFFRAVRFA